MFKDHHGLDGWSTKPHGRFLSFMSDYIGGQGDADIGALNKDSPTPPLRPVHFALPQSIDTSKAVRFLIFNCIFMYLFHVGVGQACQRTTGGSQFAASTKWTPSLNAGMAAKHQAISTSSL